LIQTLTPTHWHDYELLDTGNFEKLERFGKFILIRPEPQAIWDKKLTEKEWEQLAHATFRRAKGTDKATEKGEWTLKSTMQEQWWIKYEYQKMKLQFRLGLTAFKHVGIFPEQAENWNFIYEKTQNISSKTKEIPKVLNLFAYTGGASLAAKAAGADITHVDSVKQVVSWARENMENSQLNEIRWVVEDAFKFVKRELKRGKKYNGIILDPPAYGRGPEGEKWILEDQLNELLKMSAELLTDNHHFFVLNLYSMGFSGLIAQSLLETVFNKPQNLAVGELYLPDQAQRKLPLGIFARFADV
jgi:23S rRNA (cytosine1962-C5)-methyltransferase